MKLLLVERMKNFEVENDNYKTGLDELKVVINQATNLGINPTNIQIDLSITRGLDYYTGTVYETFFDEYPQFGSVCSGGRYDNLSSVFMDKKFPGVGISIGLTRLFDQLRDNGLLNISGPTPNKVLVITQSPDFADKAIQLTGELRRKDVCADVMLRQCKFKKKMEYANKIKIPYLVIIGEEEANNNTFTLKNMQTGEQQTLALAELINVVK